MQWPAVDATRTCCLQRKGYAAAERLGIGIDLPAPRLGSPRAKGGGIASRGCADMASLQKWRHATGGTGTRQSAGRAGDG